MSDPTLVSDVEVPASSSKWSPHFSTTVLLVMLFLSSIPIGGMAYYFFAEASDTITANAGSVDLADTTVVDLGTLWAQDRYRVEIPVKNTGTADLELNFSTSCTCTAGVTGVTCDPCWMYRNIPRRIGSGLASPSRLSTADANNGGSDCC